MCVCEREREHNTWIFAPPRFLCFLIGILTLLLQMRRLQDPLIVAWLRDSHHLSLSWITSLIKTQRESALFLSLCTQLLSVSE